MREAIIQIRLFCAEKLLSWAFDIAPDENEGATLKEMVIAYFKTIQI